MENKLYPFQVWLTSLLLGPLFFNLNSLSRSFNNATDVDFILGFTLLVWFIGFLMSIPSFILYYLSYKRLIQFKCSVILTKILLSTIAILLMVLTFYLMFGNDFYDPDFINPYGIGIIFSGLVFRINSRKKEIQEV